VGVETAQLGQAGIGVGGAGDDQHRHGHQDERSAR
jgi:hypothetical protein